MFAIRDHKAPDSWPRWQVTGFAMESSLYPNSSGWAQMLPPKYEVDTITQYWVKDILTVYIMRRVTKTGSRYRELVLNICAYSKVYRPSLFEICDHKMQISWPRLLANRRCHGNHFVPYSLRVRPHVSHQYELDTTTQYWVIALFNSAFTHGRQCACVHFLAAISDNKQELLDTVAEHRFV